MNDLEKGLALIGYTLILLMIVEIYYHYVYIPNMRRAAIRGDY